MRTRFPSASRTTFTITLPVRNFLPINNYQSLIVRISLSRLASTVHYRIFSRLRWNTWDVYANRWGNLCFSLVPRPTSDDFYPAPRQWKHFNASKRSSAHHFVWTRSHFVSPSSHLRSCEHSFHSLVVNIPANVLLLVPSSTRVT